MLVKEDLKPLPIDNKIRRQSKPESGEPFNNYIEQLKKGFEWLNVLTARKSSLNLRKHGNSASLRFKLICVATAAQTSGNISRRESTVSL
jgi:hypothetical protein